MPRELLRYGLIWIAAALACVVLTPRVQAESIDLSSATIADINDAFASDGMPFGVQFLGKPFTEPQLIAVASGYEAVSKHRAAPASTPALKGERFTYADNIPTGGHQ